MDNVTKNVPFDSNTNLEAKLTYMQESIPELKKEITKAKAAEAAQVERAKLVAIQKERYAKDRSIWDYANLMRNVDTDEIQFYSPEERNRIVIFAREQIERLSKV